MTGITLGASLHDPRKPERQTITLERRQFHKQALFSVNQSTPGITALLIHFKDVAPSKFPN